MNIEAQGIKSLEVAFGILECFKDTQKTQTVGELSQKLDMSKSRIHKYLVTFTRLNILKKDNNSRYSFGSKIIELGISALNQHDLVSISEPYLIELKDELNLSIGLAICLENKPTLVKYYKSNKPINIEIPLGLSIPLLSAVGKCFCAFLTGDKDMSITTEELQKQNLDKLKIQNELSQIRKEKISYRDGPYCGAPGNKAIASPVLDYNGEIVAAVVVVGFTNDFELDINSDIAIRLKNATEEISKIISNLH